MGNKEPDPKEISTLGLEEKENKTILNSNQINTNEQNGDYKLERIDTERT